LAGLSFYTSEKTLRAAFEPFGELVEGVCNHFSLIWNYIYLFPSSVSWSCWRQYFAPPTVKIIMD